MKKIQNELKKCNLAIKYYPKKKIQIGLSIIACSLLLIIVNVFVMQGITKNIITTTSQEPPMEHEVYEFPDKLDTSQDYYQQYFKPQHNYVESLQIRLALNNPSLLEEYDWEVQLNLLDEDDGLVCSTIIEDNDITNWQYYKWDISQVLDTDKVYKLEIRQIEGKSENGKYEVSFCPFYSEVHIEENVQFTHNGEATGREIEIIYTYQYKNVAYYAWLIVVNMVIVIIVALWYRYLRKDGILKVMLCLTPVVAMTMSELIAGNFLTISVRYWLTGIILNYFIYGLFVLFSKRIKWATTLYCVINVVIALVIYYVSRLRERPFLLQDILSTKTATNVMNQYSYEMDFVVGCAVMVLILWIILIIMQNSIRLEGKNMARKASVLVACGLCYIILSSGWGIVSVAGITFDMWDVQGNYTKKGTIITLLAQIEYLTVDRPNGYSVQAVENCVDTYAESQSRNMEETITPDNIILIMNESWTDFDYIAPVKTDDDITPFMDSLSENTEKGYLHMPVFGAGTANSEYEVLTGNSVHFLASGSTAYQIYSNTTQWGMASVLKQQGYDTSALHPNDKNNWNRDNVYPKMLFDNFYALENWYNSNPEIIRWCVSDREAYKALIKLHREKTNNTKLFNFLVTMQNHGGYNTENFESTIELQYENKYPETEQYLTLVNESDDAFQSLVEYYSTVKEPTMIVMFGDHLPAVGDEFYEELFGKELDELSLEEKQKRYVTPYIIWTNYDCEMEQNLEMSANYFGSYILEKAGATLTDYQKCNIQFRKEIPIIGVGGVCDKNGNWYKMDSLPEELETILNDYKIMQYNYVFDTKHRVDSAFTLSE